jgi:hypothetical protein
MAPNYYYPEKYTNDGYLVFQVKITNVGDNYFSSDDNNILYAYVY